MKRLAVQPARPAGPFVKKGDTWLAGSQVGARGEV